MENYISPIEQATTIDDLNISLGLVQWLENYAKIKTISELTSVSEAELTKVQGFKPRWTKELTAALAEKNLSLKQT